MFGHNFLQLYFITNLIYTMITFIFLHKIIAQKLLDNHKEKTSHHLDDQELQISMNIYYIFSAFLGSIRLLKDILNLLFNPKRCVWLYYIYKDKE